MSLVLVADADADRRDLYCTALVVAGYSVIEAASIAEALSASREHRPALVFASWDLEDGDGAHLCRLLHEAEHLEDMPVVVIAEQPRAELRDPAARAGCEAVLSTPVLPDHLVEVTSHLIERDRRHHPPDATPWARPRGWSSVHWRPRRRLRDEHA